VLHMLVPFPTNLFGFQFINDACDANLPVGHGQWSCTRDVDEAQPFMIDGREIRLIDTPGFDDTTVPDSEILGRIGRFLSQK
jgi:predicted GTPase